MTSDTISIARISIARMKTMKSYLASHGHRAASRAMARIISSEEPYTEIHIATREGEIIITPTTLTLP